MSGYDFFFQTDDGADQITVLKNIKQGITDLSEKTPPALQRSCIFSLHSSARSSGTDSAPVFSLSNAFTCAQDEFIKLSLLRWNGLHDWADIPPNSQILFMRNNYATSNLITLATYGKPLINNLATAVYNQHIYNDGGFNMTYNANLGNYLLQFGQPTVMRVLTEDLARYMNVNANSNIVSVNNQIRTGVIRAQKSINLALQLSGVTAQQQSLMRDVSGTLSFKNVLCEIPILSGSYILANYRPYIEDEAGIVINEKSISSIGISYIDTRTGSNVPVSESQCTLNIGIYKA